MTKKEINELAEAIKFENKMYREGNPIVSDREYDQHIETLKSVDPDNEIFKVGIIEKEPVGRKQKLPNEMYSLNKEKSISGVIDWCNSKGVLNTDILVITPKLDGISLQVEENHKKCYTRGDGKVGQRSDEHFLYVKGNVVFLNEDNVTTFGEAIIMNQHWKDNFLGKLNPKSGKFYKSSRNTVAGLFNQDVPSKELQYCSYIRYGLHETDLDKKSQISFCNSLNMFQIPMCCCNIQDLNEKFLNKIYRDWKFNLPIDGLVIDIDSNEKRKELGRELNGNPAYAIAYKDPKWSEDVESIVTGYKFQMSKQGLLKGTIQIDPINIDGVEVTQATFYNAGFLTDISPIIGAPIKVKRSGEVIPKITEIHNIRIPSRDEFTSDKEFKNSYNKAILDIENNIGMRVISEFCDSIMVCPSCGEALVWFDYNYVELVCLNKDCRDINISKIEHFFTTCGVEEFGRPTIESLYEAGYRGILQIMNISFGDFVKIPGFGESSVNTIMEQFDKVFKQQGIPMARLMAALDLFKGKIGEKTVQLILDNISEDNVIDYAKLDVKFLNSINGVGDITAKIFIEGMEEFPKHKINNKISYITTPRKELVGDKYSGYKVCFTGVRDSELEEQIKINGGEVVSGVSKRTTHLIVENLSTTSSKAVKAKELGTVKILTLEQFKSL